MNAMTDRQQSLIHRLCNERMGALTTTHAHLLQQEIVTTRDASQLIDALMAVPTDPVEVDEAEQGRIDALKANVPNLSPKDATFALSLIGQFDSKGRLSEKQWPHVDRLARPQAEAKCDPQPLDIVDVDGDHYLVARSQPERGGRLYAKRLIDGKWSYEAGGIDRARQGHILTGDALAEFASKQGHTHGHCVFCGLELTDERSVTVGYGKHCAERRSLPWG
jgi:hypothetical protein